MRFAAGLLSGQAKTVEVVEELQVNQGLAEKRGYFDSVGDGWKRLGKVLDSIPSENLHPRNEVSNK